MQGKSIKEIAEKRGFVTTTIEGHIAHYIKLGKLSINDFVNEEKIAVIQKAFEDKDKKSLGLVKNIWAMIFLMVRFAWFWNL